MKTISIFCCIVLFFSSLVGNPIMPPAISEIYFENESWTLELYHYVDNLNDFKLQCSSGEALFNNNIEPTNELFIITSEDMQSQLNINKNGDYLKFILLPDYIQDEVYFGNFPASNVNPPYVGQSLVRAFDLYGTSFGFPEDCFPLLKDNTPSIGTPFLINSTLGTFCGYVYDAEMTPIVDAELRCCYDGNNNYFEVSTNNSGYFERELCSMNYEVIINRGSYLNSRELITIEPDSVSFYEFIEGEYNSIHSEEIPKIKPSLSNFPNPFNPTTTISFDLNRYPDENISLEIYSSKGEKIKQFSIAVNQTSITWSGDDQRGNQVGSGVYYYTILSNGKKLSSSKMLLLK